MATMAPKPLTPMAPAPCSPLGGTCPYCSTLTGSNYLTSSGHFETGGSVKKWRVPTNWWADSKKKYPHPTGRDLCLLLRIGIHCATEIQTRGQPMTLHVPAYDRLIFSLEPCLR